jgi:hypothetical protein
MRSSNAPFAIRKPQPIQNTAVIITTCGIALTVINAIHIINEDGAGRQLGEFATR